MGGGTSMIGGASLIARLVVGETVGEFAVWW